MEKIGSTNNKYVKLIGNIALLDDKIKNSRLSKYSENELKKLSMEIMKVDKSKNITEILSLERTLIRDELSRCQDDISNKGTITSLTTAMKELDLAYDAFIMLYTNKNEYKKDDRYTNF